MPHDERYALTELADLAGVTPRTIRYYLAQGLLPAVGQSGPGSKYDDRHLSRLRLIRRLQAEHLPLAEIRRRLDGLSDEEIRALGGTGAPAPPTDSALDYVRGILHASMRPKSPSFDIKVPPPMRAMRMTDAPIEPAAPAPAARYEPHSVPEFTPPGVADEPAPYGTPSMPPPAFIPSAPGPSPMERSQWDRIALSPDVELHVRRPLGRAQQKQVDRLVAIARELLEEDRP